MVHAYKNLKQTVNTYLREKEGYDKWGPKFHALSLNSKTSPAPQI